MLSISNLIPVKRRLIILQSVLYLILLVSYTAGADERATVFNQGILFKVEKFEHQPSYILGTIHSGDPRVLALSDKTSTALAEADQYVMEVVLDGSSILSSLGNLWLLNGQKLSQLIGEELYARVIETGSRSGVPEASFTYMKPWVVMIMFSLPPGNYDNILDIHLMRLALKQNKKVVGLETAEEQFAVFDDMPMTDQVRLLEETLKNYPELTKQFTQLFEAYLDKDLAKLQQLSQEQVEPVDQELAQRLMDQLIDSRNRRMVKRLLPLLVDDKNFIAVGALHLPGENGILHLLQKQGFTITRIE